MVGIVSIEQTQTPGILKITVPAYTVPPGYVTAVSRGFPTMDLDTWYFPSEWAYLVGKFDAAVQTAGEAPAYIASAVKSNALIWTAGGILALLLILRR